MTTSSNPMIEGRRADSRRRRQRVIKAINTASASGGEVSFPRSPAQRVLTAHSSIATPICSARSTPP
jgi:hypothetical protein